MATAIKTDPHIVIGGHQAWGPFIRLENLPPLATNYFSLDLLANGSCRIISMGYSTNIQRTVSDDKNRTETLLKCKGVLAYAFLSPSVDYGSDVLENIAARLRDQQ